MASYDTIQALDVVVKHGLPSAVEGVMLDLERARMEREDFRQGYGPFNGCINDNEPEDFEVRGMFRSAARKTLRLEQCLRRVRSYYNRDPRAAKYRKRYVSEMVAEALD